MPTRRTFRRSWAAPLPPLRRSSELPTLFPAFKATLAPRYSVANAKATIAIVSGKPADAVSSLSSVPDANGWDSDLGIRRAITLCIAHLVLDDGFADDHLVVAKELMQQAGAWRFRSRLAVLSRLVADDSRAAAQLLDELGVERTVVVLELADVLLPVVPTSDAIPVGDPAIDLQYPDRWISLARRQLPRGHHPAARAAARVLAEFGSVDDLPRVTAYERTYAKNDRSRPLARRLIVRTSPRLAVHDLGRVRLSSRSNDASGPHSPESIRAVGVLGHVSESNRYQRSSCRSSVARFGQQFRS